MNVHKDSITTCTITPKGKEIQTFSTKTVFLLQLIDWIKEHDCTHVAMESTGVFWKPIVNLLEAESIEFLVVNAQTRKEMYVDLGEDYFDKQKEQSIVRYSVRRLET
jgi:transposase